MRSQREASENGKKGGIKSGQVRREKATLKHTLETLMNLSINAGQIKDIDKVDSLKDLRGENVRVMEGIVLAQIAQALKGDQRSARVLVDWMATQSQEDEEAERVVIVDDIPK